MLPCSSVLRKKITVVALFDDKNPLPKRMPKAVLTNDHFKLGLPPLVAGARAFGIKKAAVDKHPDRFKTLVTTGEKVFSDPAYKKAVVKTKAPWELIKYGDVEACQQYVKYITDIGKDYKSLLTGKKKS